VSAKHEWLNLLEVSGPFLAVPVLREVFPQGLEELETSPAKRLRSAYEEWRDAVDADDPDLERLHAAWIDEVLRTALEADDQLLKSGKSVPSSASVELPEHDTTIEPEIVFVDPTHGDALLAPIHVFPPDTDLSASMKFDGLSCSPGDRMSLHLRALNKPFGLVTNGERWMLVHAPIGQVATFASWYARMWGQEPQTLRAFTSLLGIRRFFAPEHERIPALFERSLKHQDDVTEALGDQVRRAVEVLVQALDRADQDRNRELLRDVTPQELYEAGLTVMMRLVFLLAAEERGLLLLGEPRYDSFYAVSTLRMQLRAESDEILERRRAAWSRLLAVFRAVFGGIDHPTLRLPAMGGSLFDPDRFPFLEGRLKSTSWRQNRAEPLPIDDRTVLLLLEAIQTFEGRTLSYRALDVEQIGHVYEGLLERTVARVEDVTLELEAGAQAKDARVTLGELESARLDGQGAVASLLVERSKRSELAIKNALAAEVEPQQSARLLSACRGDAKLRGRLEPCVRLLRTDPWGYPLVHPKGAFVVVLGADRRETGTHYTPKSLTERIVEETLTPLVYEGPAKGTSRGEWKLKTPEQLLDLKICDPAMGSGAFLVQACRFLSARLVESWAIEETAGRVVDLTGQVHEPRTSVESMPAGAEARAENARRIVAERCLYGVDLNPLAVELGKLSLWLVTLSKGRPFGFLDHNLRRGDSLFGIDRLEQLTELSIKPGARMQGRLFGRSVRQAVEEALAIRLQLREIPIRDIRDVEAMVSLDAEARSKVRIAMLLADALVGVATTARNDADLEARLATMAADADLLVEGDSHAEETVGRLAAVARAALALHWPLHFPDVFVRTHQPGFDAIIGNPPYVSFYGRDSLAANGSTPLSAAFIARHHSTIDGRESLSGRVNTFLLFVNRTVQHSPQARCGFVLPDTIVTNESYAPMRSALTAAGRVRQVVQFDSPQFRSATVGTAILILGSPRDAGVVDLVQVSRGRPDRVVSEPLASVLCRPMYSWLPLSTSAIQQRGLPTHGTVALAEIADIKDGINPGSRETRDKLLTTQPDDDPSLRPCMEGKWISPFVIEIGSLWVRYSTRLLSANDRKAGASLREKWIFDSQKIVYRQTAPHIIAAVDSRGLCARNSVHSIVLKKHHEDVLYALCAYLNSASFRLYYQSSTGETRKVFPQVHISSMKHLRVPATLMDPEAPATRQLSSMVRGISRVVDSGEVVPERGEVERVLAEVESVVAGLFAEAWAHVPASERPGAEAATDSLVQPVQPSAGEPSGRRGRVGNRLEESVEVLARFLRANRGWHAKKDVIDAAVITPIEWNAAITKLLDSGVVERKGDRRGARYRARADRSSEGA
jgi:hypothetical protein